MKILKKKCIVFYFAKYWYIKYIFFLSQNFPHLVLKCASLLCVHNHVYGTSISSSNLFPKAIKCYVSLHNGFADLVYTYNTCMSSWAAMTCVKEYLLLDIPSPKFVKLQFHYIIGGFQFTSWYCKFINVCEGFIWRISRPSLNHKI